MRLMIGVRRQDLHRLGVAAKLICHDDARLAKLPDQSGEEALVCLGGAAPLNQDVEHIAVSIDRSSEPELLSADRNHGLIYTPLAIGLAAVPANAGDKVAANAINLYTNSFPADDHTAFGKQVFYIRHAQQKTGDRPTPYVQQSHAESETPSTAEEAWKLHCASAPDAPASTSRAVSDG
ncbi:hypothetical protein FHT91_006093 [Rhizobium sp. BK347]|nr:hypothetical protein [Rhizobium sp. BK252]MBB3405848.1 hypothetical protein [Rhizobium sp. BK289]MBB3418396.1 hypothetical protein [Rhizobium sp. BK284]MBB3486274.1 hypothetical protein [Rhizobium sp. BK347]